MMIYIAIVTGLFMLGAAAGFICAWLLFREPRKIEANLVIDKNLVNMMKEQLTQEYVNAWLDKRGMTWMSKGAVYNPDKVIKK